MQNVLPRRHVSVVASVPAGGETVVRSTQVLSAVGMTVQSALRGLPEGTMLGPYRIQRRIGRGGMGSVYEAMNDERGDRVALKVLSPELAQRPDFVARFQRESKALSRLSDPRIARVFFSGAADGLPFFAMEFIDGQNLEEILEQRGPLDPPRAVHLMKEAAVGLSVAAEHGLIHRDVKPTNLLVDGEGNLRIVDFGLAKTVDSESRLTVTGAVVGTPFYLSPEQGLGKPVDERSDIYSLGATFYHLLAGDPPFQAEGAVSIIMRHVNEAPEVLTSRNSTVPEPLARVIMCCMAKDPEKRYQDYDDLIDDLVAVSSGEPVTAPSESASGRAGMSSPSPIVDDEDEGRVRLHRASRVRRGFAVLLDSGVAVGVGALVLRLIPGEVEDVLALFVVIVAYMALGDGFGGRSLGKRFFRLRVARTNGSGPGLFTALARTLFLLPTALLLTWIIGRVGHRDLLAAVDLFGLDVKVAANAVDLILKVLIAVVGLDVLACFMTRKGETLHDLLSGTGVFRESRVKVRKKLLRRTRKVLGERFGATRPLHSGDRPLSPFVPAVAGMFGPGLGQLVNAQMWKAMIFFLGALVAFTASEDIGAGSLVWAIAIIEAYLTARKRARAVDARAAEPGA